MNDDALWTLREVSEFLHLPESTLYNYRAQHIGPPSFKMGNRVVYRRSRVLEWVAEHEAAEARYTDEERLPVAAQHAISTATTTRAKNKTDNATKGAAAK